MSLGRQEPQKNLHMDTTEKMVASALKVKGVLSKSCAKILESGEPEFAGLAIKVSRSIG